MLITWKEMNRSTMNQRTHADESPDTDKTGFYGRDSGKMHSNASAESVVRVPVVPIITRAKQNNIDIACVAIAMNAILNHVDIEVSWKNLLEKFPEDLYDVIFVGDLLYDEEIANALIAWLEHTYARGARIYLGDPGRYGLTEDLRKRLRLLRRYSLPQNVKKENCDYDTAVVWEFVGL